MSAGWDGGWQDRTGEGDRTGPGRDPYGTGQAGYGGHASYGGDPVGGGRGVHGGRDPYGGDQVVAWGSDRYGRQGAAGGGFAATGPSPYGGFSPAPPSSSAAVAGFVLGVLGLTLCGGLTSPFGVYFAAQGMKETGPAAALPKSGRGLAIAGLVTSLVGLIPLLFVLLYIVLVILGAAASMSG